MPAHAKREHQRVHVLTDVPPCHAHEPHPLVRAREGVLELTYFDACEPPNWIRLVFEHPLALRFGPPAGTPPIDAAASPHLPSRRAAEIAESRWLRQIAAEHGMRGPLAGGARYYRHFVFHFPESTFECLATGWHCCE